jgi:hypothetical protein
METIFLPISLGEAIDKLSILHIKLDHIKDDRRKDVQVEYDHLYSILKEFLLKYDDLYSMMKKINLAIWYKMDLIRDGNTHEKEYLIHCKECIEYNDIRFRIKNKINHVAGSHLKEQKGYLPTKIRIYINGPVLDEFIKPISYFTYLYDQVVVSGDSRLSLFQDPSIIFENTDILDTSMYDFTFTKEYTKEEIYDKFKINDLPWV